MTISARVPDDRYSHTFKELLKYLPAPEQLDIKEIDGRIAIETVVPMYLFLESNGNTGKFEEYLLHAWKGAYYNITQHLANIMMGRDNYFVIRLTPSVHEDYGLSMNEGLRLRIIADISVAETRHVIIPQWTYDYSMPEKRVVEWRCGACTTPNVPKQRWCTQCGSPRALLMQEMMCAHCGTPRDEDRGNCSQCGAEYINL